MSRNFGEDVVCQLIRIITFQDILLYFLWRFSRIFPASFNWILIQMLTEGINLIKFVCIRWP